MKKLGLLICCFLIIVSTVLLSSRLNVQDSVQPPNKPVVPVEKPPVLPTQLTIHEALAKIDKQELKTALYKLTSPEWEGRMSGHKGNEAAKDYLVKYYQSLGFEVSTQAFSVQNLNTFKESGSGRTSNVIAMMPGNDPTLMNETVIIGAHYDHVGYGPSMSQTPQRREVHPGADDNASGTTAVMGAAKALSLMKGKNKRRFVFISFSAEEMGLIGAKYYVDNQKYNNVVFMLNMDMVGRYNNKGVIHALGAGSSPEVKDIINNLSGYPFKPSITSGSGGGSDHVPFYNKGIPICFLHTGMHGDYHTPEDTADKIDFDGLTWVSKYSAHIAWEVCQANSKPSYRGVAGQSYNFNDHDWKKQ